MRISDWSSDVCSSDLPQEIVEHLVTVLGGDAFRVELHAMDGQIAVTHAHDEAVGAGRVHHQRIRQAFRLDDQRVIARRGEGRGKAREYAGRSEEHTSELQSLMRISYAVFCLQKKKKNKHKHGTHTNN